MPRPCPPRPRPCPPESRPCADKDFAQFINPGDQSVQTRFAALVEWPKTVVDCGHAIRKCPRSHTISLEPGKYRISYYVGITNRTHLFDQEEIFSSKLFIGETPLDYTLASLSLSKPCRQDKGILSKTVLVNVCETSILRLFVGLNRLEDCHELHADYLLTDASLVIEKLC